MLATTSSSFQPTTTTTKISSTPSFPGAWPDPSDSGHTETSSVSSMESPHVVDVSNKCDLARENAALASRLSLQGDRTPTPALHIASANDMGCASASTCYQNSQASAGAPFSSVNADGLDLTSPLSASLSHDSCMSASSVTTAVSVQLVQRITRIYSLVHLFMYHLGLLRCDHDSRVYVSEYVAPSHDRSFETK